MNMKRFLCCLLMAMLTVGFGMQAAAKEKQYTLKSPNNKLVSHIVATAENEITYDIVYDGVTIMLP